MKRNKGNNLGKNRIGNNTPLARAAGGKELYQISGPPEAAPHPRTHSAPAWPHMPGKGGTAPAGLAGCRCTQSWFAGSSGRLRLRKHESIQNTSCLDIASLFIRQGFGNLEQLVPSTPNPLLPENGAALVAQLARASAR